MKIPLYFAVIDNLAPEVLSEESLNHVIYSEWYKVGNSLCIDFNAIPIDLLQLSSLPVVINNNITSEKLSVSLVHGFDKKWDTNRFYV